MVKGCNYKDSDRGVLFGEMLIFSISGAAEYLYFHRVLVQPDDKRATDSLWGKLASEILMQDWDTAYEDLHRLRENIDSNVAASPLQVVDFILNLVKFTIKKLH